MQTMPDEMGKNPGHCPACGQNDWKRAGQITDFSISGEPFEIIECQFCRLKATFPRPQETEIGRYYASEDYISHSDTRKGLINSLYHLARTYMLKQKYRWVTQVTNQTQGSLLDIGAGTGHFPHFMKGKGWQVTALEPDENARSIALQKLQLQVEPLDMLNQLPPATFDLITLWHVLEHVYDLDAYLKRFKDLLKPGGTLLIAVPNHTSRDAAHYGLHWAAYDVPRHLWHFSPESMNQLLTTHGFALQKKIPMHLDAFYVSMLSEKYRGQSMLSNIRGGLSGCSTWLAARSDPDKASSILYVAK